MNAEGELSAEEVAALDEQVEAIGRAIREYVALKAKLYELVPEDEPFVREWAVVFETTSVVFERTRQFSMGFAAPISQSAAATVGLFTMGVHKYAQPPEQGS